MKRILLLLFTVSSLFAQTTEREQGLLTGEPFWRQALGGRVLSLPSVQAGSAVVALDGGNIKAYSTAGTPMWSFSARGRISPFVSRSREGTSYLSRTNGNFIAVNRAGTELWRRNLRSPLVGKVITGWDGRLFIPVDKKLFCYTAAGTLLWTKSFTHSYTITPILDQSGGVIFALKNNEVYKIDPFGNTSSWKVSANLACVLSVEKEQIVAVHADGTLEVLGADENWFIGAQEGRHASILPRLPARPIAAASRGNNIVSILNDGRVAFVSIDERRIIWTANSHIWEMLRTRSRPEMEAEIIFDNRGIFVLSKNGAAGFSHDGKRSWYTLIQNAASTPALGDDGILYSGGRDWILYAYKIEDRALLRGRGSLYGPAPGGSYGIGTPKQALLPKIPIFDDEIQSVLEDYQKEINKGNVGENEPAWCSFLLTLSVDARQPVQNKVAAIRILGQIGSRETVPWLVNIFRRDQEPLVRAAAAAAIGSIGVDPEGRAIQTFLQALTPENIKDEQLLTAITKATADICRFSGPPLSETGIKIFNLLTTSGFPASIRSLAERELASLL